MKKLIALLFIGMSFEAFSQCDRPIVGVLNYMNTIYPGDSIMLKTTASGTGPYTFKWSTGSTMSNIKVSPLITTTYSVTIKDSCWGNGNTAFGFVTVKDTTLCGRITKKTDEFTNDITYSTPFSDKIYDSIAHFDVEEENMISCEKIIRPKTGTGYYLSLISYGPTCTINKSDITILFTDGTKLYKTSKIDVEANEYSFTYSAFIRLTKADIDMLGSKSIKAWRLYIYDEELNAKKANNFRGYLKCLINKK